MQENKPEKMDTQIDEWLKPPFDEFTQAQVKELVANDPTALKTSFGKPLHFGTAGVREIMGLGPSLLNLYTIQKVTQALANYILTFSEKERQGGVVICFDCRHNSKDFAHEAARVLAGNGIAVHITKDLRPTPFASFCTRYFGAIAAINITASHNPKEYNGYKIYWHDGGQIVSPHDKGIIDAYKAIESQTEVKLTEFNTPLIQEIKHSVEEKYLEAIDHLQIQPALCHEHGSEIAIFYSAMHGCGITMIPEALKRWGFYNVQLVKPQDQVDGAFPSVEFPNPELQEALTLGLNDLKETRSDILLTSDPDSDRLSACVLHNYETHILNGNELGALLLNYIIQQKKPKGRWATVTTIVSSPLVKKITESYSGTCFEVLTGFKYIGQKIYEWESSNDYTFLFGMEESLGYLYGTHSRDKDATIAACLSAEMALYYKTKGKTLIDALDDLYESFGIYREGQLSVTSKEGQDALIQALEAIRKSPPTTLFEQKVLTLEDYKTSICTNLIDQSKTKLTLPTSDVLIFTLEDQSRWILRPSGTEPKLKIYGHMHTDKGHYSINEAKELLEKRLKNRLSELKTQLL
jgi:phosphomannomutase